MPNNIEHYGCLIIYSLDYVTKKRNMTLGLELAKLADLPDDVLKEARRVTTRLSELEDMSKQNSEGIMVALRRKAMLRVSLLLTMKCFI